MEPKDQQLIDMTSDRDHYQTELGKAMQQLEAKDAEIEFLKSEGRMFGLIGANENLAREVDRLKRGDFTPEEFQNLCHNKHEKWGCSFTDFADGCADYQKQLFGKSERDSLQAQLAASERKVAEWRSQLVTIVSRIEALYSQPYPEAHHYLQTIIAEMALAARKEDK